MEQEKASDVVGENKEGRSSTGELVYTSVLRSLTLGTHAQRGLQYLVCVSVCVCVPAALFSHLQTRNTSDFSVTWAAKLKGVLFKKVLLES